MKLQHLHIIHLQNFFNDLIFHEWHCNLLPGNKPWMAVTTFIKYYMSPKHLLTYVHTYLVFMSYFIGRQHHQAIVLNWPQTIKCLGQSMLQLVLEYLDFAAASPQVTDAHRNLLLVMSLIMYSVVMWATRHNLRTPPYQLRK